METLKEAGNEILAETKAQLKRTSKSNDYPKGVKAIYDNGGKTFDRYTVYYNERESGVNMWACLGMSESPFHPQGFGQHCSGMLGRHNGKRIAFAALPEDCQKCVNQDLH